MSYMAEGSKLPCYLPIERICTAWEKIWILNAPLSVRENCEDDSQAVVCFLFSKHRSASMHYIWIWKQGVIPDLTRVLSLTTPTIVYHKSEVYYYIKMALTSQHKQRNRFVLFFTHIWMILALLCEPSSVMFIPGVVGVLKSSNSTRNDHLLVSSPAILFLNVFSSVKTC